MEINVRTEQGITIVSLGGDLNARAVAAVQEQVMAEAQRGGKLILDLKGVPYLASAGVRMLLMVTRTVAGKQGRTVLVGLSDEIKKTLQITGFLESFAHRDSL